jgi:hypothetical protein
VNSRRAMRRSILALIALNTLSLLVFSACRFSPSDWVFARTGEEDILSQGRGLIQLGKNLLHPQPNTAPDAPVAYAGVNPFGINVFLEQEVEAWKREKSLQMVADAGFHWIRQEFPWEDIEIHGKGDFEDRRHEPHRSAWEKYDHIVELADQYDLELIVRLSNPPAWTRADVTASGGEGGIAAGSYAPPDDLADWGDYVSTVVSRYRQRVRYYQLWNEPNIYPEWGEQPVDPEGYTQLLCEGHRRAKEADPDAVILSGALAPTVSLNPGPGPALGMNEFVFLQHMYDAGAAACFDVLTVNDYMLWSGPTDRRMQPLTINFSRPAYIRDIMVANGDAHKPIWISEMNSNAVPDDPTIQGWGGYGQVTLEQQARYAVLAYQRAMEEWPWVGVINFWFFKRASDLERNQAWYYFRMAEPDFTPLPVYDEMRRYTAGLTPTLYPGTHQEDHWGLLYASAPAGAEGGGGWETVQHGAAMMGAYRRAAAPGAELRFVAEGASLTLVPGPGTGEIAVVVDGSSARRVPLDGRPVRLVRDWWRKRREIILTVAGGEVAVDGIVVQSPWYPTPWLALGTVGLILAAIWSLARLIGRRRRR